ncbi:MAG: class I SAM-dependent DNA methyltransferase [Ignavibacteriales bacterium]
MNPERVKPYQAVAEIYAYLMRFINYDEWAEYYFSLTRNYIPSSASVLELASGNCKLSTALMSYYRNIVASDLSSEMLKKSEAYNIKRVCCNMEMLPFKNKFDLVISAFDSINYLLTKKSINNTFREVHNLLSENGVFSFDVSLENNSLRNLRHLNRKGTYKGILYIQKSDYNRVNKIHTNTFTLEFEDGTTYAETHRQKIFPFEVYFDLLTRNGFVVKECLAAFSFDDADHNSERVQFLAIKNNNYA